MFSGPAGTSHLAPNRCPSRAGSHSGRRSVITYRTDSPRWNACQRPARESPGHRSLRDYPCPGLRPVRRAACQDRHRSLPVRNQDPARARAGSSPRRYIGVRVIACCMLADARSATTPVVNDHCAGGGQGAAGRPVVVAAQQQINRIRASRGGRDEDPDHRPGGAAAGAVTQSGRPVAVSLVVGCRSGSPVVREPRTWPCGAETSPPYQPVSDSRDPSQWGPSTRPGQDLRP